MKFRSLILGFGFLSAIGINHSIFSHVCIKRVNENTVYLTSSPWVTLMAFQYTCFTVNALNIKTGEKFMAHLYFKGNTRPPNLKSLLSTIDGPMWNVFVSPGRLCGNDQEFASEIKAVLLASGVKSSHIVFDSVHMKKAAVILDEDVLLWDHMEAIGPYRTFHLRTLKFADAT